MSKDFYVKPRCYFGPGLIDPKPLILRTMWLVEKIETGIRARAQRVEDSRYATVCEVLEAAPRYGLEICQAREGLLNALAQEFVERDDDLFNFLVNLELDEDETE